MHEPEKRPLPDFEELYFMLLNAVEEATALLQKIQQQCGELYSQSWEERRKIEKEAIEKSSAK